MSWWLLFPDGYFSPVADFPWWLLSPTGYFSRVANTPWWLVYTGVEDPGSWVLDERSWKPDPGCSIQHLRSWVLAQVSKIRDPGSWVLDPGSKSQSASRIRKNMPPGKISHQGKLAPGEHLQPRKISHKAKVATKEHLPPGESSHHGKLITKKIHLVAHHGG